MTFFFFTFIHLDEVNEKDQKIQCPHCSAKLHAKHMPAHIDVMHPLGGNEVKREEEEVAEALDALEEAKEIEKEAHITTTEALEGKIENEEIIEEEEIIDEQGKITKGPYRLKRSTLALTSAMYEGQRLRTLATKKLNALKFRLRKGLSMLFDTYVEMQKDLDHLEEKVDEGNQEDENKEDENKEEENKKKK